MLGSLLFLALQAATSQPVVLATAAEAAMPDQAAPAAAAPAEPQRKKVCRTTLDTRTGPIAKARKSCWFVDADKTDAS